MSETDGFAAAVAHVLEHEGGYVSHVSDPGGATAFGISQRSYPDLEIASLTREDAIEIYRRDWWNRYGYGFLKDGIAAKLFDIAVNTGHAQAVKLLQRALRSCGRPVAVDGQLGPVTRAAIEWAPVGELLAALCSEQAGFYRVLIAKRPALAAFERGWTDRAYWRP